MSSAAVRHLRLLTRYSAWANARLFGALDIEIRESNACS